MVKNTTKKPRTPAQIAKMKKIRKGIFWAIFILINIAVIIWTATSEFGDSGDAADLSEVKLKWWMLIPAALCFAIAVVAEIYKYYMLMRNTREKADFDRKKSWGIASSTVLLGRYYDNITPAAIGGQPFQIFFMNKSGVKNGYGTAIPLVGMISDQMGYLLIGALFIIIGSFAGWISNAAVVAAGWIGLLCYAFFPIIILAATFLPKTTEEILSLIIKFLGKIHILKNPKEDKEKAITAVRQYADSMKAILRTKGLFLKTLVLGCLYYIGLTAIPFFVLQAFGANINFFTSFATTAAVSAAVYFIPTPGNAGAAEGTFYSVFSILPNPGYVFWAMMFWRFFVYYSFIAIGFVVQLRIATKDKHLFDSWKKTREREEA